MDIPELTLLLMLTIVSFLRHPTLFPLSKVFNCRPLYESADFKDIVP